MIQNIRGVLYRLSSFSLIWILICLDSLSFMFVPSITKYFDYFIFAIILVLGGWSLKNKVCFDHTFFKIFCCLFLFIGVQCFGLLFIHDMVSARIIVASCCTLMWLTYLTYGDYNFQKNIVNTVYIVTAILALLLAVDRGGQINTFPAEIAYITIGFLFINFDVASKFNIKDYIILFGNLSLVSMIAILFHCRSIMLALFIMLMMYWALRHVKVHKSYYYGLVLSVMGLMYVYINLEQMPCVDIINNLSVWFSGKQFDIGRAYLWSLMINSISGINVFIGLGTGALPVNFLDKVNEYDFIELFKTGSCHNTYVQIYIQNGILGVWLFIKLMHYFFIHFLKKIDCDYGKMALAALVGIMIYNCFECALLQNKFFLGIIQWTVLGIAYRKIVAASRTKI